MISVELHLKLDFTALHGKNLQKIWLQEAVSEEIYRCLSENINDFWDWKEYGVEIDPENISVIPAASL